MTPGNNGPSWSTWKGMPGGGLELDRKKGDRGTLAPHGFDPIRPEGNPMTLRCHFKFKAAAASLLVNNKAIGATITFISGQQQRNEFIRKKRKE